jgi:hypothetical protein
LKIGCDIGDSESAFAVACYRWLSAPAIESEAVKRALKLIKEYENNGVDTDFEEFEIIRALLAERGIK